LAREIPFHISIFPFYFRFGVKKKLLHFHPIVPVCRMGYLPNSGGGTQNSQLLSYYQLIMHTHAIILFPGKSSYTFPRLLNLTRSTRQLISAKESKGKDESYRIVGVRVA
jgi:hypothetical protein